VKIELLNIEHDPIRTEETPHFRADLHVDGTKIGIIYNGGTGGDCCFLGDQDAYRAVEKWVAANMKIDDEMAMDLDTYCFGIVFDLQEREDLQRILKRAVVTCRPDGEHMTATSFPKARRLTRNHIEQVRQQTPRDWKILNEMPFDDAFALYQTAIRAEADANLDLQSLRP